MTSFLMKVIMCPLLLGLASFLFPNVNFTTFWQPVIIGIVLALVGSLMEALVLSENTVLFSTILDFIATTLIVYFGSMFFVDAYVTFGGALLTAVLIGIAEHFTHRYLVRKETENKAYS